ncbi:hypothetical protein H4R33_006336 [Dimargaris cristalligena]|nr:hypothetical protein H4R33_006336 [Dimargaris cristalligena]
MSKRARNNDGGGWGFTVAHVQPKKITKIVHPEPIIAANGRSHPIPSEILPQVSKPRQSSALNGHREARPGKENSRNHPPPDPPLQTQGKPKMSRSAAEESLRALRRKTQTALAASKHQDAVVPLKNADSPPPPQRNNVARNIRRRSSFANRGKRASSQSGGTILPLDPDIDPKDFYKHISPDIPEPQRMRQLIAWCIPKAGLAFPKKISDSEPIKQTMKETLRQIYKAMVNKDISTSWYHRPDTFKAAESSGFSKVKAQPAPHPINVSNVKRKQLLEKTLERLQREERTWRRLIQQHQEQPLPVRTIPSLESADPYPFDIDISVFNKCERRLWDLCRGLDEKNVSTPVLQPLALPPPATPRLLNNPSQRLAPTVIPIPELVDPVVHPRVQSLEPAIDQLTHTLYVTQKFHECMQQFADSVASQVITSFQRRTGQLSVSTSSTVGWNGDGHSRVVQAEQEQRAEFILSRDTTMAPALEPVAAPVSMDEGESSTPVPTTDSPSLIAPIDPFYILKALANIQLAGRDDR